MPRSRRKNSRRLAEERFLRRLAGMAALLHKYVNRTPQWKLIPTLAQGRVLAYHRVSTKELESAWPGERVAVRWDGIAFLSPIVPEPYVRFLLVYFHYLQAESITSPNSYLWRLTCGRPHFRAAELDIALAKHELAPQQFEEYLSFRRQTDNNGFFARTPLALRRLTRRIDRLVELWRSAEQPCGISSAEEVLPPPYSCPQGKATIRRLLFPPGDSECNTLNGSNACHGDRRPYYEY